VSLAVYSTSLGVPTYDPRIKYYETGSDSYWNTTETVVFDPDADGFFNPVTDWILYNRGVPLTSQMLSNDPRIKFVDTNFNGLRDPGEPIVYDLKNEGIYDLALNDPVINGTAVAGSLLQDPVRMQTSALFDQVELYSQTGNYDWIRNGGFETGDFTGWGNTAGFTVTSTQAHSGSYSTVGTATGTTIDLAQSIDARPAIDSSARLQASAYVGGMTGASSSDKVDLWLGLVDSSPQANPLSIYYYFKTGTSSVPSNTTDTVNQKVSGFGSFGQWLSLNQSLLPDTGYFNLTGHTAPYRIETVVLEVSAQTSLTTSAYFDDLSIPTAYKPGPAVSTYYAVDGLNSTYSYTATKVPQGQFYISVPVGQSLLNITSPAATVLQLGDYSVQALAGLLFITVLNPTAMTYPALSTWRFYTTSRNALASLYATPTGSTTQTSKFDPGSSVTFASRSRDPTGNPLAGSNVTLIFYSSINQVFTGKTNSQGWYNQTNVILTSNPGPNTLEAITVSSSYIGLRTNQLTINNPLPWTIIIYISIAAAALAIFGLLLLRRRRKRVGLDSKKPSTSGKNPPGQQRQAKP
jgi:MYXO-CTERM domain-containing protein